MKRVVQQRWFRLASRGWMVALLPALLWVGPADAVKMQTSRAAAQQAKHPRSMAGCRDGWHRVGTIKDPTLRRTWAVVASCSHPAWPAHLEPANRWQRLAAWVPAGSRIILSSPGSVTAMHLDGRTVTPARVGQAVTVRLTDGVRVRAKLINPESAEMAVVMHWRQP